MLAEGRVALDEPPEGLRGHERTRRRLDCTGLVRQCAALHQAVGPEVPPRAHEVDGAVGLGVGQPHHPLLHDEERAVDVVALLQDDVAGGVQLEGQLLEERFALVGGERVERLGAVEERLRGGDGREHGRALEREAGRSQKRRLAGRLD